MKCKRTLEFGYVKLCWARIRFVLILPILVCLAWTAQGQTDIQGSVIDQEGELLIGVNIQIKGSSKGTATDFEGRFTLEDIDENTVLN